MNSKNMETALAYLKSWNNGRIADGRRPTIRVRRLSF